MACSNCKCNPKKDAVPQDGGVPGTTGNGDIDLSKYTHIEFHKDLSKEVEAIHKFLRFYFPELKNGATYWSQKKDIEQAAIERRDWAIQDLRDQGYTVTEPAGSTGE